MKIVALYSAGTTVSWQTARRRNTFHPVPLCPHPSVYPSVYVHFTTERNGTERKRKRINESTTNTRVEEWLIENLYHPVWYSFISGIRVLSIGVTYVHNFARNHASYGQIFFSLSLFLASIPGRNDWNFSGLDFRPSRSSFFRRASSVKCD